MEKRHGSNLKRPTVDEYFMNLAHHVATRSTCLRRSVGAVIVKDKRLLATGYNGTPAGVTHCIESGCIRAGHPNLELYGNLSIKEIKSGFSRYRKIPSGQFHELCRGVHAEQNAIIQAAYFGKSIKGADIYSTTYPCVICARMIINSKIRTVIYDSDYVDQISTELLEESEIDIIKFEKSEVKIRQLKLEDF